MIQVPEVHNEQPTGTALPASLPSRMFPGKSWILHEAHPSDPTEASEYVFNVGPFVLEVYPRNVDGAELTEPGWAAMVRVEQQIPGYETWSSCAVWAAPAPDAAPAQILAAEVGLLRWLREVSRAVDGLPVLK